MVVPAKRFTFFLKDMSSSPLPFVPAKTASTILSGNPYPSPALTGVGQIGG